MHQSLKNILFKTTAYVVVLLILFALTSIANYSSTDILQTALFAFALYMVLFMVNRPGITNIIQTNVNNKILIAVAFLFMMALYLGYALFHKVNPFTGMFWIFPLLLVFPLLAMCFQKTGTAVNVWDFLILFLFFIPAAIYKPAFTGKLPLAGSVLDSIYRITMMLSPVIAFGIIRNVKKIGFYPSLSWRALGIVLVVWLLFYSVAFLIGYNFNFIQLKGINIDLLYFYSIIYQLIRIFIHTALFEELFFRGLMQNMLTQKINSNWQTYFKYGSGTLVLLSIVCGVFMKASYGWMPLVAAIVLFACAWWLETKKWQQSGVYTGLAITSVVFGLLHFHAGSAVFVALAAVGGWAYGYVYIKTGSTFYAALLHALVNTTPYIVGLQLLK